MKYLRIIVFSILLTSIVGVSAQQNRGGVIKGEVADASTGDKLEFIEVLVVGTKVFTMTDSLGRYELKNVPLGFQSVSFRSIGFKPLISDPVQVTVAKPVTLDVQMTPDVTELSSVQVVGRSTRRIETPPIGVYRVNIKQIEKSPGGNRDVSKVVQNLPGVAATAINRNDLIVRGGGPNENKFYLDRIEIPVINHFQTQGASGGNASIINSDFLNGVTLYTSAFPASRGNALSSVMDLRMKEGNPDRFKARFAVGASDVALTLDTPLGNKASLIASYRVSYLQFLFAALKLPFLPTYQDAQFKFVYDFDSRNKLKILGLGSFDINRLNTSMGDLEPDRQQILDFLPENDQWSYVVGAVYTHLTNSGSLDVVLSTNRLNNSLQKWTANDKSLPKTLDYVSNETEFKSRVEYNTAIGGGFQLNTGVSLDRGYYDNNTARLIFVDTVAIPNRYETKLFLTRYAAYAGLDKTFFNTLRLNLSVRFDGNNYSSAMENPLKQFSPRLALSWEFVPRWSFNANIGRYFQEPGYTTMGYRDATGTMVNRDRLQYIQSDQVTAGFAFEPDSRQRVSLEGFYKNYSRYPMSMVDSTAIGSGGSDVFAVGAEPATSVGRGRAYGVELAYRNDDLWGFMINTSYTYFFSEFRKLDANFEPTGVFVPSNWDYRHIFNFTVSRSFGRGWDVGLRWRFMGGAPYTPYDRLKSSDIGIWQTNKRAVLDYSLVNTQRLPAFHQLDVRVDKTWYFNKWTLALYLDIQNLYNYKAYGQDILMPETDLNGNYVKDPQNPGHYKMVDYANQLGGTIIPTFGVIIEF